MELDIFTINVASRAQAAYEISKFIEWMKDLEVSTGEKAWCKFCFYPCPKSNYILVRGKGVAFIYYWSLGCLDYGYSWLEGRYVSYEEAVEMRFGLDFKCYFDTCLDINLCFAPYQDEACKRIRRYMINSFTK